MVEKTEILYFVKVIDSLRINTSEFINSYNNQPLPNSKAVGETETFQRPESVVSACTQGSYLLEVAADQLMAFVKTCTEPVMTIAPRTRCRAMLEARAIGIWLLDPAIDVRTRVARSFALRYEGLAQQMKFFEAGDRPEAEEVRSRMEIVENVALGLGFNKLEDIKGRRIGIAKIMPSITDLIRDELDQEAYYRLFSAAAHAHFWALRHLSFRLQDESEVKDVSIFHSHSNVKILVKDLDPKNLIWLCRVVAKNFALFLSKEAEYFGWDLDRLDKLIEHVFIELKTDKLNL